ncbi:MAG: motility associated factor glycosyltransferase family protein [bacterium]|nr:motility associated factor glycosyltransferase family protein [bacterium]
MGEALGETEWLRSGGTVAASAVFLAVFLGAENVMLIGQDLAFTSGRRYAEGSLYEDMGVTQHEDGSLYFTNLKIKADLFGRPTPDRELAPGTLRVEGWHGEEVWTDRSYASFREEYRAIGKILAPEGVRLINCTEGGARIPGLEHEAFGPLIRALEGPTLPVEEALAAAAAAPASGGLAEASRSLAQAARLLQTEANRALEKLARFENGKGTAAEASLLRAAAKAERKVHKRLGRLPVVEFLTQNELHELQLASRKTDGSVDGAVDRSKALLEAVIRGAEGVIEPMGRIG